MQAGWSVVLDQLQKTYWIPESPVDPWLQAEKGLKDLSGEGGGF